MERAGKNMKTKITVLTLYAMLFALCASAEAQQPGKIPLVGILFIGGRDQPHLQSFKQGLRERGYTEGKNIKLEYKYAEGKQERLDELAAEFVRDKVDIIVTTASVSALAARKVTQIIPIIMTKRQSDRNGIGEELGPTRGKCYGANGDGVRPERQTVGDTQRDPAENDPGRRFVDASGS